MTFFSILIAAVLGLVLYHVTGRCIEFYEYQKKINRIPGPTFVLPWLGLIIDLWRVSKKDRLEWYYAKFAPFKDDLISTWAGPLVIVHVQTPELVETILRSNTEIAKSRHYDPFRPWLGNGLLTGTGQQWHRARKMLTPAFHFKILEKYTQSMMDKSAILTKCMEKKMIINGDKPFDIYELCAKATLDIMCETAMGVDIGAQGDAPNEYLNAVRTISDSCAYRLLRPWLKSDFFFYKTAAGQRFTDAVAKSHDTCTRMIVKKQEERKKEVKGKEVLSEEDKSSGARMRKAFLHLMLEANEKESNPLTIQEIRDQVNTFLFAGHDTTGAAISWTLFSLGVHLDIQKKVHKELDEVLGGADEKTTLEKLHELKYLERVIKETLRLYPSVTFIGRTINNDFEIGGHTVPKGTAMHIQIYNLHRDPAVWPEPRKFDPDRFLPENINLRHPYAYVPFSAGARNCIGQKFAMLEIKLTLVQVLRKFSLESVENHDTIKKYSEPVLRPLDGIYVNMKKR